jgi:glycosyltransferase involved in cell wall biosynthesis
MARRGEGLPFDRPPAVLTIRLLFLVPFRPDPEGQHGGARVTGQLIGQLARTHEVAVLYFGGTWERPGDFDLASSCHHFERVPPRPPHDAVSRIVAKCALARGIPLRVTELANPAFADRVTRLAADWRPDVVQIEFAGLGQYVDALRACPAPRVLVDHDATMAALRQWNGPAPSLTARLESRAWRRYKRRTFDRVGAVVCFTGSDARVIRELGSATPIHVIGPGAARADAGDHGPPAEPARADVLFVGNFRHPPNVDAARRLIAGFAPIRARVPEATLTLVGAAPPADLTSLAATGISFTGEVPEVRPYLEAASVVAAPIHLGGGMRVKVLEALMAGKALVATPLAVEGLALEPGVHAEIAQSDEALAARIAELLEQPARRQELGARARAWAQSHLSWDATAARYEALYASLLGRAR